MNAIAINPARRQAIIDAVCRYEIALAAAKHYLTQPKAQWSRDVQSTLWEAVDQHAALLKDMGVQIFDDDCYELPFSTERGTEEDDRLLHTYNNEWARLEALDAQPA